MLIGHVEPTLLRTTFTYSITIGSRFISARMASATIDSKILRVIATNFACDNVKGYPYRLGITIVVRESLEKSAEGSPALAGSAPCRRNLTVPDARSYASSVYASAAAASTCTTRAARRSLTLAA